MAVFAIVLWVKSMLMNRILISDAIALHECIMRKDNNYGYEIMLANAQSYTSAHCNLFCVVYSCS